MRRLFHLTGRVLVGAIALSTFAILDVASQSATPDADAALARKKPRYPAVVNDSLALDWRALDGVTSYSEDKM